MKRSGPLKAIYDVPLKRGSRAITRQRGALIPALVARGSVSDIELDGALYVAATTNIAVVSATDDDRVAIVDYSDPDNPFVAGSIQHATQLWVPQGIAIRGTNAFVAIPGSECRITTVSFATPATPSIIGSKQDATNLSNALFPVLYDAGGVEYVIVAGNEVSIWDADDPTDLQHVSTYDPGGSQGGIGVHPSGLVVTTRPALSECHVYDISTIGTPTFAGEVMDGIGVGNEVIVKGDYAFVSDSNNEQVCVVDFVSDPSDPVVVETFPLDQQAWDHLAVFGEYVMATELATWIHALDTHNELAVTDYVTRLEYGGAIIDDIAVADNFVVWVDSSDNSFHVAEMRNFAP